MAIAPGVQALRKRVGYRRYRALHEFLKETSVKNPTEILLAVRHMVDINLKPSSFWAVEFLLDEIMIQEAKERGDLPLLIGTKWRSDVTQRHFEQLLKGK